MKKLKFDSSSHIFPIQLKAKNNKILIRPENIEHNTVSLTIASLNINIKKLYMEF